MANGNGNIKYEDRRRQLFDLIKENDLAGSYDYGTFDEKFSTPEKVEGLYKLLKRNSLLLDTEQPAFVEKFYGDRFKKKGPSSAGSVGSSSESAPALTVGELSDRPAPEEDSFFDKSLKVLEAAFYPEGAIRRKAQEANYKAMRSTFPDSVLKLEHTESGIPAYVTEEQQDVLHLQEGQVALQVDASQRPYQIAKSHLLNRGKGQRAAEIYRAELTGIRNATDPEKVEAYEKVYSQVQESPEKQPALNQLLADEEIRRYHLAKQEFQHPGEATPLWTEYDRGEVVNQEFSDLLGRINKATSAIIDQVGEDNWQEYRQVVSILSAGDPSVEGYEEAAAMYHQFRQDPRYELYDQYASKAGALVSKWKDAAIEYPAYYDTLRKQSERQQRVDMLSQESFVSTIKGAVSGNRDWRDLRVKLDPLTSGFLPRSVTVPMRREVLKAMTGLATIPFHAMENLSGLPGMMYHDLLDSTSYDYSDAVVKKINRFMSPENNMYLMTTTKQQRPVFEDVAEVDGFTVAVNADGTAGNVYNESGYVVDGNTRDAIAQRYEENRGKYEVNRKVNGLSVLGTIASGSAQLALTVMGGVAGRAVGVGSTLSTIGTQTVMHTNEIYKSALRELGPENADVASQYALTSALAVSSIALAVNPLEARLISQIKPVSVFKADAAKLKTLLESGVSKRAAIETVSRGALLKSKNLARKSMRWAQNVGKEGSEGILEELADQGLRATFNVVSNPTEKLEVGITVTSLMNAFAEEALGALLLSGADNRVANTSPAFKEGLMYAYAQSDRDELIGGLEGDAQKVYSRVFASADQVFAENPEMTVPQKMQWLAAEVGKERAGIQSATGTLTEDAASEEVTQAEEIQEGVTTGDNDGVDPIGVTEGAEVAEGLSDLETLRLRALSLQPGQQVRLPDGSSYTIRSINDDGTVTAETEDGTQETMPIHGEGGYIESVNEAFDRSAALRFPEASEDERRLAQKLAAIRPSAAILNAEVEQAMEAEAVAEEVEATESEVTEPTEVDQGAEERTEQEADDESGEARERREEAPEGLSKNYIPRKKRWWIGESGMTNSVWSVSDYLKWSGKTTRGRKEVAAKQRKLYTADNIDELRDAPIKGGDSGEVVKVIDVAINAVKSVSKVAPVGIVVYDTSEAFAEAMSVMGFPDSSESQAIYLSDGTIHLNVIDVSANPSVFAHEILHGLVAAIGQFDTLFVDRMFEQLKSMPEYKKSGIPEFIGAYAFDRRKEEAFVEFVARVSSGEIDIQGDDAWSRVKKWFQEIIEYFGFQDVIQLDARDDLVKFAAGIKEAFDTGKELRLTAKEVTEGTDIIELLEARKTYARERKAAPDYTDVTFIGAQRMVEEEYEYHAAAGTLPMMSSMIATHFGLSQADVDAMVTKEERTRGQIKAVNPINNWVENFKTTWAGEKLGEWAKSWNRLMHFSGAAPRELAGLYESMRSAINAETEIAIALSSRVSKMIDAEKPDMDEVNAVMRGYLTDPAEAPSMSTELFNMCLIMRDQIDTLSKELIENGFVYGQRLDHVAENFGYYMNRSYRAHMDPGWTPEQQIVDAAVRYIYDKKRKVFGRKYPALTPAQLHEKSMNAAENDVESLLSQEPGKGVPGEGKQGPNIFKQKKDLPPAVHAVVYRVRRGLSVPPEMMDDLKKTIRGNTKRHMETIDWYRQAPAPLRKAYLDSMTQDYMDFVLNDDVDQIPWTQEMAPEIRKVLGEYEHPLEAYTITIMKTARYVESARFLGGMQALGLGSFLWTKENAPSPNDIKTVPLFGKGNTRVEMATRTWRNDLGVDLNEFSSPNMMGMFVRDDLVCTPEVKELMVGMENVLGGDAVNEIYRFVSGFVLGGKGKETNLWRQASSGVNWLYTVMSTNTTIKNFFGNIPLMIGNGYLRPGLKNLSAGMQLAWWEVFSNKSYAYDLMTGTGGQLAELSEKLKRSGLLNQEVSLNAIKSMLGTSGLDLARSWHNYYSQRPKGFSQKTKKGASKAKKWLEDLYQSQDNFFKVTTFIAEADRMADALYDKQYKNLSKAERAVVDSEAIEIAKNTLPNYGRIGALGQSLSSSPVLGSFLSFKLESIRVTANQISLMYRQLTSKNPKLRLIGAQRAIGLGIVHVGRAMILAAFNNMMKGALDWGGDEEEEPTIAELRRFVPPWVKYSDIVVYGVEKGKIQIGDLSTVDPYGMVHVLMNSIAHGEPSGAILTDFLDETVLAQTVQEVMSGETGYGDKLYDPTDTGMQRNKKIFGHLLYKLAPGTLRSIVRTKKMADRGAGLWELGLYWAPGITNYPIDVSTGFYFAMDEYYAQGTLKESYMASIRKQLYKAVNSDLPPAEEEIEVARIDGLRRMALEQVREDYLVALKWGADPEALNDIVEQQTSSRFFKQGKLDRQYIITGNYKPLPPNKFRR